MSTQAHASGFLRHVFGNREGTIAADKFGGDIQFFKLMFITSGDVHMLSEKYDKIRGEKNKG